MICSRSIGCLRTAVAIPIASGCARMRAALPWSHTEIDLPRWRRTPRPTFPDTSAVATSRSCRRPRRARPRRTVRPLARAPRTPVPLHPSSRRRLGRHGGREPQTPPPTISLAIPEAQRIRLDNAYRATSPRPTRCGARSNRGSTRPQGKEKLQTAGDLLVQARAAMEAQNLEAAANLAHKARLLAQELLPR